MDGKVCDMEQIGEKCENFNCGAPYEDICCGECYKCVLKGCRVCKHLDQCVAEHYWNEDTPKRIVERLEQQERQYNRRAKEFLTLGEKVYYEKNYAKACSYGHAIEIVKEEM